MVTGASGGIGAWIARALARAGMNVGLCARREDALEAVAGELRDLGVRAQTVAADLAAVEELDAVIGRAEAELGPLDVLVNNAGIEIAAAFTRYSRDELTAMVDLNLVAPMLLTHRVLPGMLERGRGHVVFVASVAGKQGPAYEAPYAATKAGLVGLTQALRAEHLHSPVGFSAVCPGFVAGEGMYERMLQQGVASNRLMGSTTIEKVAERVVEAIRRDVPEILESGTPLRPVLALGQLAPRLAERTAARIGATDIFRRMAAINGRE